MLTIFVKYSKFKCNSPELENARNDAVLEPQ
jgi:hypothetical protein